MILLSPQLAHEDIYIQRGKDRKKGRNKSRKLMGKQRSKIPITRDRQEEMQFLTYRIRNDLKDKDEALLLSHRNVILYNPSGIGQLIPV